MDRPPTVPVSSRFTAAGTAVLLALAGSAVATGYDRAGTAGFVGALSSAFAVGAIAVVGAIVTFAVPGNRVGWLMLAAAAAMGMSEGLTEAGVHGVVADPGSVPDAGYLATISRYAPDVLSRTKS